LYQNGGEIPFCVRAGIFCSILVEESDSRAAVGGCQGFDFVIRLEVRVFFQIVSERDGDLEN